MSHKHNDLSHPNPDERGPSAKERDDKLLNVLNIRKQISSGTPPLFVTLPINLIIISFLRIMLDPDRECAAFPKGDNRHEASHL
jgi:hypothetical protein